ncbi:AraC family transcriptional regulator [Bengtsoniella intestinalis]|uniref:helix-turn-helix transcriptional regulator n=1 Tax=Bengtsoniella intestinalis TaxID=3073143 RepID=UPI00391F2426
MPVILDYNSPSFFFIKSYFDRYRFNSHMSSPAFIEEKSLAALACTHQLTAWIISQKLSDVHTQDGVTNQHLVSKIQEYLCSHIDSSVQVSQLAQHFFISPNYLGHVFKNATGTSIKEYHNALRMDCAYQLLKRRQYSISEVSAYLGFHDLTYFSRKFKAYFHVAPSEVTF